MLITFIIFLLLSNGLSFKKDASILYSRIAISILIYCLFSSVSSFFITYLSKGLALYGGLFNASSISHNFHILIFIISIIILQLTGFLPKKSKNTIITFFEFLSGKLQLNSLDKIARSIGKISEQFSIIEYPLILLFIICGAILLLSSNDLVSIFLSIELQSYALYLLCVLYRNSELATGSGLTYFLLGGLSSCFILLGIALIYINTGVTNLESFYIITSLSKDLVKSSDIFNWYDFEFITYSLLLVSVGLLFKISAAPFHFWSPDVYDGIPTVVTTFVALIAKLSILTLLLELIHHTCNVYMTDQLTWTYSLTLSSLLSLIIGTVLGLTQPRIKRMLAYSTISHLGFMLLALTIHSIESNQAFFFYIIQYTISNLNAFIILIAIGFSLFLYKTNITEYNKLVDKENSPIQLIGQLKGYYNINPIMALSFIITMFSFVGIPPLVGFFGKQMVLSAAMDSGYIFLTLIGIVASVISAVYYLNIVKTIFFDSPEYIGLINPNVKTNQLTTESATPSSAPKTSLIRSDRPEESQGKFKFAIPLFSAVEISLSNYLTITIAVLTLLLLAFIFSPEQLLILTNLLAVINFSI